MNRKIILTHLLLLFFASQSSFAQTTVLYDDFEGNGIVTWNYYEDAGKPGIVEFAISNPSKSGLNTSTNVAKFTKTSTSNAWMNAYIDVPGGFDLSVDNQFSLLVYSSVTHQVKLKLQPGEDYTKAVEKTAMITTANTWQLLTFDFSSAASRKDFTKLNIHFNDGIAANGIYYFDVIYGPPLKTSLTISDDGEIKRLHEDGETIKVKLFYDTFVQNLNLSNWTFENLPEGVSVSQLNRISDNEVNLILGGNATDSYSKSITNFSVTVSNEELSNLTAGSISVSEGVLFDASCWKLIWADEFNTEGLPDNTKWSFEVMAPGAVNNELQNYVANRLENARVESGILTIECRKDNFNGQPYSSARIRSAEKGDWINGKIVTKAKIPSGKGTWPAIWMLSTDSEFGGWPASGEIDIMEHVGYDPGNVHASIHTAAYNHTINTQKTSTLKVNDFNTEFHEYTIDWKPELIDAYIDSTNYFSFANEHKTFKEWPFDKRFHMILNLAYGGDWGGAQGIDDAIFARPEGVKLQIDYVRVYKNIEDLIITGPDEVFVKEKNISFSIEKIDGVEYTWLPSDDYSLVSAADSNVISINWDCETDTIKVNLLVDGTENYTITKIVKIKPCKISGDSWVEEMTSGILYTTQNIEGAIYTWSGSNGIVIASGQGNDSIRVNFGEEGNLYLQLETSCGIQYDTFTINLGDGQFAFPEGHEPYPIPGKIVAAHFDLGGEGVAYHDSDAGNNGGVLRTTEDVDLEQKDASYTIGWCTTGEWLEYTVNVAESSTYELNIRAGGQSGGKIRILQDETLVSDTIALTATGSWDIFKTISSSGINLEQGISKIKVEFVQGGCNLGDMVFSKASNFFEKGSTGRIELYPNPASDKINIRYNETAFGEEFLTARIYSLQGQLMLDCGELIYPGQGNEINISFLPKGVYFLELENQLQQFNTKFIRK